MPQHLPISRRILNSLRPIGSLLFVLAYVHANQCSSDRALYSDRNPALEGSI
jgi:hypothetical protein